MDPKSGRLVFRIGDAFPADDRLAMFIVAMATALNDLITSARWLVGGKRDRPSHSKISDVERLYLLRLGIAQLHEFRETVKNGRKDERVADFLDGLPASAKEDLERVLTVNTDKNDWIRATVEYVRNQTNHYGGKWNWEDVAWAMTQVKDSDGEVEMVHETLAGMRLRFADLIAVQYLTRKFPEYRVELNAELDDETIKTRLASLFQALAAATAAAQNFAAAAVNAYLDTLPDEVIRVDAVAERAKRPSRSKSRKKGRRRQG